MAYLARLVSEYSATIWKMSKEINVTQIAKRAKDEKKKHRQIGWFSDPGNNKRKESNFLEHEIFIFREENIFHRYHMTHTYLTRAPQCKMRVRFQIPNWSSVDYWRTWPKMYSFFEIVSFALKWFYVIWYDEYVQ